MRHLDLSLRRSSDLGATTAANRLNISPSKPHTSFAAASDCRALAIYEFTGFVELSQQSLRLALRSRA
jgi:hypothetical protein